MIAIYTKEGFLEQTTMKVYISPKVFHFYIFFLNLPKNEDTFGKFTCCKKYRICVFRTIKLTHFVRRNICLSTDESCSFQAPGERSEL